MNCQYCGSQMQPNWKYCPFCDSTDSHMSVYPSQYVSLTSNCSKSTVIILCLFGFVGFAGFHRLYVGKIFSGLLYLITFGFFFMGTIFDLIQLLLGQFTDNVGQPIRR